MLVAPPQPRALAPELREGKFVFAPDAEALTCPAGVTSKQRTTTLRVKAGFSAFRQLPAVPANSRVPALKSGAVAPLR